MPTENATREKLLFPSSTLSISFSSPSIPSIFSSLCFPFFLFSCTSVFSPSNSGHEINSSSESWPSIPANASNATAILCTSFLNPLNSSKPSSFHKTSDFHSASVCCFAFLALDLLAASDLAFACTLSVSKGLQAALALAQGAQEVAWLRRENSAKKKINKWKITYGKFWGMQSIPKSAHLSHGLPPPTTDVPISLANFSRCWRASGVSFGR